MTIRTDCILKAGYTPAGPQIPTGQLLELIPGECGKTWITKEAIRIEWRGKTLTVPQGYKTDYYTFGPNLPDMRPSIAHDFACEFRKWDDGTTIPRADANRMFRDLMRSSPDAKTRSWARCYFFWVEVYRIVRRIP